MNKVALITGASGGIGYAFAEILAKEQYDLVLVARNVEKLFAMKQDFLNRFRVNVHVLVYDLGQTDAAFKIFQDISRLGFTVDVLINNAGIGDWGAFADSNEFKLEQLLQLNIVTLTQLTRLLLAQMVKQKSGKILNVASTAAFVFGPLMSVYFASKAYVLSFSCAIAQELKDSGVTVTCLCPGPTATDFQAATFPHEIRLTSKRRLPSAKKVAQYGYQALVKGKLIAVYGLLNKIFVFSVRFVPRWLTLRFVYFMQEAI